VIEGERLRVPGKGGDGIAGTAPVDLYLVIRLAPHRRFRAHEEVRELVRFEVFRCAQNAPPGYSPTLRRPQAMPAA
jgi:hypothetical protein